MTGLLVALAIAGLLAVTGHPTLAVAVAIAGVVAAQLTALAWRPWVRLLRAVERGVGALLRLVLLGAVFAVAIIPSWLVGRVIRHDPLAVTTRVRKRTVAPSRPFARERSLLPVWRRVAVPTVLLLLAAAVGARALSDREGGLGVDVGALDLPDVGGDPEDEAAPTLVASHALIAHEDAPWAADLFAEEAAGRNLYDPYLTFRPGDQTGRYLNVSDQVRRSYETSVGGDPLVVWFFGGSTMFGVGQRDDHTIASEIVRLAEADDIAVEAVNFGMSAYVNWQETLLFLEQLQKRAAPDLVVFYDGANDVSLYTNPGGERWPSIDFAPEVEAALTEGGAIFAPNPETPAERDETERVQHFLTGFSAGVRTAEQAARANGITLVHFLQPVLATKRPLGEHDREAYDVVDADEEYDVGLWERVRALSFPSHVIDVTTALDGVDEPLYFDQVHTNELGAELVARAMYEHLGPRLDRLDAGEET